MLQKIRSKKAQSTLEYAVLVVIVIAALLALQTYMKRGIGGRLHSATDDIGDQYSQANSAGYYKNTTTRSVSRDTFQAGVSATTLLEDKTSNTVTGIETSGANEEYWGK